MTASKIYSVKFANGFSVTTHAANQTVAMANASEEWSAPQYCRIHAGIADRSDAPTGQMGYFTPSPPRPVSAVEMRETWMDCGHCLIPA